MDSVNGYRLVRWVGDPSPYNDPKILQGIMEQKLSMPVIEAIRTYDRHQRICAIPGKSELTLGPSHGFSQTYVFGPEQFAVWVAVEDLPLIFDNEWARWEFLDITDNPSQTERTRLSGNDWKRLLSSFAKLDKGRKLLPHYR